MNTREALAETQEYLTRCENLFDSRDITETVSHAGEDTLTLGALRSLYALAVAALGMRQKIAEADAAYTAATGER